MNFQLNLTVVLRYLLAGAYALVVFSLSFDAQSTGMLFVGEERIDAITVAVVATLVGSITYSLYRALVLLVAIRAIRFSACMSGNAVSAQVDMWTRRKNENSLQRNLFEWADQSHFLACSGLSGLSMSLLGEYAGFTPTIWITGFKAVSVVLILAAVASLYQLQARQKIVNEKEPLS
jgi:hypothetical protein